MVLSLKAFSRLHPVHPAKPSRLTHLWEASAIGISNRPSFLDTNWRGGTSTILPSLNQKKQWSIISIYSTKLASWMIFESLRWNSTEMNSSLSMEKVDTYASHIGSKALVKRLTILKEFLDVNPAWNTTVLPGESTSIPKILAQGILTIQNFGNHFRKQICNSFMFPGWHLSSNCARK